ncbi:hypothetical protein A2G94_02170 [Francisella endosymbiont of Ornithodoros moubata]|nr:hypothetical protein A2G94_02170 [Francisella endosymbiont of Ornithodoros moubata]
MGKYSFINSYAIEKYKKEITAYQSYNKSLCVKVKSGQLFLYKKAINVIKHNMAKQTAVEYVKTNIYN